ncbi:MAG: DedA family protein [Prevotellaceae bacterium]|nr:DedA family protein [Prevotellaceae bacterium]
MPLFVLSVTTFLAQYGYAGMGVAAFLAGSFIPFSSEVIMTSLYVGGLELEPLIVAATVGNVLGGVFNYGVGRLCNEGWVYRLFRIKEDKLERSKRQIRRYGAWVGLLSWIPVLGSAVTLALGILRVNVLKSFFTITLGKLLRYLALGYILSLTS